MAGPEERSAARATLAPKCVSIDLEIGKTNGRILKIGAVRGKDRRSFSSSADDLAAALRNLDAFADGAVFVLGHNIVDFGIPHLRAAVPGLRLLELPVIDTLRLNPLAFPRNPYHHLVKHYQDAQLRRRQINDPVADARLTIDLFLNQRAALAGTDPALLCAWHWLTTVKSGSSALDSLFMTVRQRPRPTRDEALAAMQNVLAGRSCASHAQEILLHGADEAWPLAYALAWISVADEKSVMPPWVRHQFPQAREIVRRLRDLPCTTPSCPWCSEQHDARKVLQRFFGFDEFRPEPAMDDGSPMQQAIVEAAMRGEHVLGILPTGTGKSICYQVPALSRYVRTGVLTVVISPLVALMEDQVDGLRKHGIEGAAALNGLLTIPERTEVLDGIRLGDVSILIVSPEQLRSRALRNVLEQREIGAWVMDEAHCLSKWGHDFRPDYRYVGRYIRERAGDGPLPALLCLTATAKPEVVAEICDYFSRTLGVSLRVFDGGSNRSNLVFEVIPTTRETKFEDVRELLASCLPDDQPGGAIVYCATRQTTEELTQHLQARQVQAGFFHAGLKPDEKQTVQHDFISGRLRVITATNAFGMGIDKPDVRVVIHADIPGSLENYIQEAGRAGRDREYARCVLLYAADDVERQFGMSARSRLSEREIQAILKSLKRLDRKKHADSTVVATAGEILAEDDEAEFGRDSTTDDTRVRTAICWLEESKLLTREENVVQFFPSSLRVATIEDADRRFEHLAPRYRSQLRSIVTTLLEADSDDGVSTDELSGVSGLQPEALRKAFFDLEHLGVATNDTAITAYIHHGVERSSQRRLEHATHIETQLIAQLRELAPDMRAGDTATQHLRQATQTLRDGGNEQTSPSAVNGVLRALALDGRGDDSGLGSIRTRKIDTDHVEVCLQREWAALDRTAELRRSAAGRLLAHLLECLPSDARGNDLLVETTMGRLAAAIEQDVVLRSEVKNVQKLLDRALLWLHEQRIIRLNKGLTVFRPAMTIRLSREKHGFQRADFEPLKLHYAEQVLQIHVMAEYAMRGLQAMADALHLAFGYFSLSQEDFLARWLPNRERELGRQTTPESWQAIVKTLANPVQQRIVQDDREQTNVLVLAGPGSGKTRVLVHRIAYLIRVRRERPTGILALAYNRHAAVEIRRRLHELIGNEAFGVTILTCHAMAMRLTGTSFAGRNAGLDDGFFRDVLQQATALLNGYGLLPDEADEQRERLLAGFRWILVDEYQDIAREQYELISALAGRTLGEEDGRLTLFAVGDDDQNIYAFNGASVEFIRRFEEDYKAKPSFLVENYRSTGHIINASNLLIAAATNRLKAEHPITIDRKRRREGAGGAVEQTDAVGGGRVQILQCSASALEQALAAMSELERLAALHPDWDWARAAVIAREWRFLEPVRACCELQDIPVQMADEENMGFWRLRETQALIDWIRSDIETPITATAITEWLATQRNSPWNTLLLEALAAYALETGEREAPRSGFIEWLAEWGREIRHRQSGLLLLSAHRAKGLEFDHVVVLDGGWDRSGANEDSHAARRLYYVAMTRARKSLCLLQMGQGSALLRELPDHPSLLRRNAAPPAVLPAGIDRIYQRTSPGDVDLGFAGRLPETSRAYQAIRRAHPGDPLQLVAREERIELRDRNGITLGRMSRSFRPRGRLQDASVCVAAIITRTKDDGDPEHEHYLKCERWETIVPAFEYERARKANMDERRNIARYRKAR